MKYKIGDRVKTEYGTGTVVEIGVGGETYLVQHDTWSKGHNGSHNGKDSYSGYKCYWFYKEDLQPLNQITPEVGKIYKVKDGEKCGNFEDHNGEYIKIDLIRNNGFMAYDVLNKEKNKVSWCSACLEPEDLIEVEEENMGINSISLSAINLFNEKLFNNAFKTYYSWDSETPEPKKGNFMTNIVKKIKDLALSETDRLLRNDGFEDEQGKMTEQARQMMREEMEEERWKTNREEVAKKLKQLEGEK